MRGDNEKVKSKIYNLKSMRAVCEPEESVWKLRFDVATAKVVVWILSGGRDVELADESHLYLFDRYSRLAGHHRRRGHNKRANRLQAIADEHYELGGGDPPRAAAMAMPRPRRWISTEAVSRARNSSLRLKV